MAQARRPKMLFVLEGNTDIRFVAGLCEYFDLTLLGPTQNLRRSGGLLERIEKLNLSVSIIEVSGGRLRYQLGALIKLFRVAKTFDVLFCQENLRGTLNAGIVGRIFGVPVVSHSGMPPREYFRCRYQRKQIGFFKYLLGDLVIRILLWLNARLCHYWFVLGPFLYEVFSPYKKNIGPAHYYGVDTKLYHPVPQETKERLREQHKFSPHDFIIFFSSRVSHEKDPETVLSAVFNILRKNPESSLKLMNLGGGHQKIRELAEKMHLERIDEWLVTRPAAHPMEDLPQYYQLSDLVIQSSLEEGLGLSPLEALSCGIPVIASNVGGMKANLKGHATLVEPKDAVAMENAILNAMNCSRTSMDNEALNARHFVELHWNRELAFENLSLKIYELIHFGDYE